MVGARSSFTFSETQIALLQSALQQRSSLSKFTQLPLNLFPPSEALGVRPAQEKTEFKTRQVPSLHSPCDCSRERPESVRPSFNARDPCARVTHPVPQRRSSICIVGKPGEVPRTCLIGRSGRDRRELIYSIPTLEDMNSLAPIRNTVRELLGWKPVPQALVPG